MTSNFIFLTKRYIQYGNFNYYSYYDKQRVFTSV